MDKLTFAALSLLSILAVQTARAASVTAGATLDPTRAAAVCNAFAAQLNRGTLEPLQVPFDHVLPESFIEKQPTLTLNAPAAKVDIGGNGRRRYVFLQRYMDKDQPDLIILDEDGKRLTPTQAPELTLATDPAKPVEFSLIRIGSDIFIMAGDDDGPHYLSYIGRDDVERLVCTVERKKPSLRLLESNDERLCPVVLKGDLDLPKFDQPYTDKSRNFHGKLPEVLPQAGAAQIDIDNDGKPDLIVRLTKKMKPLMAHGCSWTELAVLNDKADDLDKRRTAMLPHGGCDSVRLPFRFDDQTYVLGRNVSDSPGTYRRYDEVLRFKDNHNERLCRIDRTPVFEVQSVLQDHSS